MSLYLIDWSGVSVHYSGYNDPVVRAIQGGAVDKINVHKRIDKIDKVLYNIISTCAFILYRGSHDGYSKGASGVA